MASAGSPPAYLLWALLSVIFLVFLVVHLWSYDRFQCLRWNSGRQPGAFKRVMTYSYLGTVPLLIIYSIIMAWIKYREGYIVEPALSDSPDDPRILPKPMVLWDENNVWWLMPLMWFLSCAWSLELCTHIEELAFWLYLLQQGQKKRPWFRSWEFRAWCLGSIFSFIGLTVTTIVARENLDTCEAWIFVIGSALSTVVTVLFVYVLVRFPCFIREIRREGAAPDVVVRLTAFYQLNIARVVFRFLFTLPLLAVGLDGIQGPHRIVFKKFLGDFLFMIAGIGCFVSSAITLLIFFPRSVTRESGFKVKVSTQNPSMEKAVYVYPDGRQVTMSSEDYNQISRQLSMAPSSSRSGMRMSTFKFPAGRNDELFMLHPCGPNRPFSGYQGEYMEASPEYQSQERVVVNEPEYVEHDDRSSTFSFHGTSEEQPVSARSPLHSPPNSPMYENEVPSSPPPPISPPLPPPLALPNTNSIHLRRPLARAMSPESPRHSPHSARIARPTFVSRTSNSNLHPYVQTFTSPIDLLDQTEDSHLPRAV